MWGITNSHVTKELRKSLSKVGFFSVLKATRPKAKSVDVVKKILFDRFSLQQDMRKVRMIAPSNKGFMHTTFDLLLEAILRDKEMRMVGNWSIGKSISMIQVRGGPLLCRYHFPCPNGLDVNSFAPRLYNAAALISLGTYFKLGRKHCNTGSKKKTRQLLLPGIFFLNRIACYVKLSHLNFERL